MLALLFPGQASQSVGMGRDVFESSRAAREIFETADDVLQLSLSKICFEGPEEELRRTEIQQPAILTTSIALLRALEEQVGPLSPAYVGGTASASTPRWSPPTPSMSRMRCGR